MMLSIQPIMISIFCDTVQSHRNMCLFLAVLNCKSCHTPLKCTKCPINKGPHTLSSALHTSCCSAAGLMAWSPCEPPHCHVSWVEISHSQKAATNQANRHMPFLTATSLTSNNRWVMKWGSNLQTYTLQTYPWDLVGLEDSFEASPPSWIVELSLILFLLRYQFLWISIHTISEPFPHNLWVVQNHLVDSCFSHTYNQAMNITLLESKDLLLNKFSYHRIHPCWQLSVRVEEF